MTPGTKVRTKVEIREFHLHIPAGTEGTVVGIYGHHYGVHLAIAGHSDPVPYRSDELETIE